MEGRDADKPTAGGVARRDVATCRLDETLGAVRARAKDGVCIAVNDVRVVLGILREPEFKASDDTPIAQAMRPGPPTYRPNVPIAEIAKKMVEHDMANTPITSADGALIGLLHRADAVRAAGIGDE